MRARLRLGLAVASRRAYAVLGDEADDRSDERQQHRAAPAGARVVRCADERDRQHDRRRHGRHDEQHSSPAADERDPHDRQHEERRVARLSSALRMAEQRDETVTGERQDEQGGGGRRRHGTTAAATTNTSASVARAYEQREVVVGRAEPRRRERDQHEAAGCANR